MSGRFRVLPEVFSLPFCNKLSEEKEAEFMKEYARYTRSLAVRAASLLLAAMLCGLTACSSGVKTPSSSDAAGSGETQSMSGVVTGNESTQGSSGGETTAASDGTNGTDGTGGTTTTAVGILRPTNSATTTQGNAGTKTTTPTVPVTPEYDFMSKFPSSQRGKTIRLLYWSEPTAAMKKQIADFKKKTGVTVSVIQTTWDLYATRLTTLVSSNSAPDIACATQDWWPSSIIKNLFQDISAGEFDLKNDPAYDTDIMDIYSWNGKYYGVAVKNSVDSSTMNVILYNKTKFKRAGLETPFELWKKGQWNWDTYLTAAKKLTETKNGTKYYGTAVNPESYMLSANTDFVKFETSGGKTTIKNNLADPLLEKAWKFYVDTREVYNVEPVSMTTNDFYTGKVAMLDVYDARALDFAEVRKAMTDELGVAPFPSPAGQTAVAGAKAFIWGIPRGAKTPIAASYFIRYFLDPNTLDDSDLYINGEAKAVYAGLVNMKKNVLVSRGVVGYNTMDDFWGLFSDVAYGKADQVAVNLKSWNSKLNSTISEIEKEMKAFS